MAIYSFNHDTFGKTTNRAGAAGDNAAYNARDHETKLGRAGHGAGANAAYNARDEATYTVRSHVIPAEPDKAEAWFREQEKGDRKNARMSDRFIAALPRELTPEQCIEAVENFVRGVTQDRVPWHFALHQLDKKDAPDWNPHAHIIIRDRDLETGKRFLNTSASPHERQRLDQKGIPYWTTKDFRETWCAEMNQTLERAGFEARVDHRSLKEQGIDREAQIHEGPKARAMAEKAIGFESQDRLRGDKAVLYTLFDEGSRIAHNAHIAEANKAREQEPKQSPDRLAEPQPRPSSMRQQREMQELLQAQGSMRKEMLNEQQQDRAALFKAQDLATAEHKAWAKQLYADAREKAFQITSEQKADQWKEARQLKDAHKRQTAIAALKLEQKALYAALAKEQVDAARPEKDKAYQTLKEQQAAERLQLREAHKQESISLARQHIAERLAVQENWRAQLLDKEANRIGSQLGGNQGMVAQQTRAVQMIRLHQHAAQTKGAEPIPLPQNPAEAARGLIKQARAEQTSRAALRDRLTGARELNRQRAGPPRSPAEAAKRVRAQQIDPQSQARQAAQSGRSLSAEQRANASPDVKEKLDRQDKAASRERHGSSPSPQQRTGQDKGRSGGGRGR